MSHTDKTDPHWVKLRHTKNRRERHGYRCYGENCDIDQSLLSYLQAYKGPFETRTIERKSKVPNPAYDPTQATYETGSDYWPILVPPYLFETYDYTYQQNMYNGPRCSYEVSDSAYYKMYACNCSWCSPAYDSGSRRDQRELCDDLARQYNSGYDIEDEDYVFDAKCRYGWVC
jgi:hypothetical protein